jgi:hypothetical protein
VEVDALEISGLCQSGRMRLTKQRAISSSSRGAGVRDGGSTGVPTWQGCQLRPFGHWSGQPAQLTVAEMASGQHRGLLHGWAEAGSLILAVDRRGVP